MRTKSLVFGLILTLSACGDDGDDAKDLVDDITDKIPEIPDGGTALEPGDPLVNADQSVCPFEDGEYTMVFSPLLSDNACEFEPRISVLNLSDGFENSKDTICGADATNFTARVLKEANTDDCETIIAATCYSATETVVGTITLEITSPTSVQGSVKINYAANDGSDTCSSTLEVDGSKVDGEVSTTSSAGSGTTTYIWDNN